MPNQIGQEIPFMHTLCQGSCSCQFRVCPTEVFENVAMMITLVETGSSHIPKKVGRNAAPDNTKSVNLEIEVGGRETESSRNT